jgi:hypothetical protein
MDGARKRAVRLTAEQRERLEGITRNGNSSAKRIMHARVLLMSDQDHPQGRYKDAQIGKHLGVCEKTVARIRSTFVRCGEAVALDRKVRESPPVPPKLDGAAEATLVAICCSPPPAGRARWTLSLLAEELVSRKVVTRICKETVRGVRGALKKNELQPWRVKRYCIPEKDAARFVAQMEDVLDVYAAPPDPDEPLVCMDEAFGAAEARRLAKTRSWRFTTRRGTGAG